MRKISRSTQEMDSWSSSMNVWTMDKAMLPFSNSDFRLHILSSFDNGTKLDLMKSTSHLFFYFFCPQGGPNDQNHHSLSQDPAHNRIPTCLSEFQIPQLRRERADSRQAPTITIHKALQNITCDLRRRRGRALYDEECSKECSS